MPPNAVCIKSPGHLAVAGETVVVLYQISVPWDTAPHRYEKVKLFPALEWLPGFSEGLL